MDQAFLLRAKRMLDQRPSAHLLYTEFAALAVARQETTPTAQAHGRCEKAPPEPADSAALATLLLGEPGWSNAVAGQSCCFSRAIAIRRINPR
jgi:aminoglycoside phosphotransferase (APT) family kinase protein